jgi:hypothetical protein
MKPKQSSPIKDELGINGFTVVKPKKECTLNIDSGFQNVKDGVESLFNIIGQLLYVGLPPISQLEKEAREERRRFSS